MKVAILVIALMVSMIALPVLAQDHSQHRSSPPATEPRDKPTPPSTPPESEAAKDESTESELRHIPPNPPAHSMPEMSEERMMELMDMDDTAKVSAVLVDQLESYRADASTALAWSAEIWYGDDYDKVSLTTEGERLAGSTGSRLELVWDRVYSRWWNLQAGVRHDSGNGPSRTWAAVGASGLAPYWVDAQVTLYVGEGGRAAARLVAEHDLLLTQRLILRPDIEANFYSKEDRERDIGAGLSDLAFGIRLRYEIRREIAPYLGVTFTQRLGDTADLARIAGQSSDDVRVMAGLRLWF